MSATNRKKEVYSLYLDPRHVGRLKAAAKVLGISVAAVVRDLIDAELDRHVNNAAEAVGDRLLKYHWGTYVRPCDVEEPGESSGGGERP